MMASEAEVFRGDMKMLIDSWYFRAAAYDSEADHSVINGDSAKLITSVARAAVLRICASELESVLNKNREYDSA